MYNEDSYTRHLNLLKAKRIFSMVLFSIIGCIIGVIFSSFVVTVLMYDAIFRPIIIAVSTLLFFFISLFITGNTSKEIEDGYWKVAVLRKLTLISKKLDNLDNLQKLDQLLNIDLENENDNDNNNI